MWEAEGDEGVEKAIGLALLAGVWSLGLAGCLATDPPKPVFQTVEVRVPVPVPCEIDMPALPRHLEAAAGKGVLEKGNAAVAELEEVRAGYALAAAQVAACRAAVVPAR